jgi:hypothetical protein
MGSKKMIADGSIEANVRAVLRHLGIEGVEITQVEEDRVFGWDTKGRLLEHMIVNNWIIESDAVAQANHGSSVRASFREKQSPSLQVCIHHNEGQSFVEIDIDFHPANPGRPDQMLAHGAEVIRNAVSGKKTDQALVAKALLEKRGIC